MANRSIIYDEEQVDPFDVLWQYKDFLTALGLLATDITGQTTTVLSGFGATAQSPASLSINLATGRIYQQSSIDATSYGALASDSAIVQQQGIAAAQAVALSTSGLTSGQSRWALIQAAFLQQDVVRTGDPTGGVLNYWNSANPTQPFQGPNNNGQSQPTERQSAVSITVVYGTPATTGSEVPPNPSSGNVPLYLIDLAFGQTAINQNQILIAGPSVGTNVPNNYSVAPFLAGLLNSHHNGQAGQAPKINLASEVQGTLPAANAAIKRTSLTANTTFYISPSGSDITGNGTSGNPWATLQNAWNVLQQSYDLNGFTATVQLGNGTYGAGLAALSPILGAVGAGSVVFQGSATPGNVIVSVANNSCFSAADGACFTVLGMTLQGTGISNGLFAQNGSLINFSNPSYPVVFGSVAGGSHILVGPGGQISALANYTISGGAAAHLNVVGAGGAIFTEGVTATLTGTPAFANSFANVTFPGQIIATGMTYSGSATGPRYDATLNGVIQTNGGGANFFPGNAAGSVATRGQYA